MLNEDVWHEPAVATYRVAGLQVTSPRHCGREGQIVEPGADRTDMSQNSDSAPPDTSETISPQGWRVVFASARRVPVHIIAVQNYPAGCPFFRSSMRFFLSSMRAASSSSQRSSLSSALGSVVSCVTGSIVMGVSFLTRSSFRSYRMATLPDAAPVAAVPMSVFGIGRFVARCSLFWCSSTTTSGLCGKVVGRCSASSACRGSNQRCVSGYW
jgi:hypothetical protein